MNWVVIPDDSDNPKIDGSITIEGEGVVTLQNKPVTIHLNDFDMEIIDKFASELPIDYRNPDWVIKILLLEWRTNHPDMDWKVWSK